MEQLIELSGFFLLKNHPKPLEIAIGRPQFDGQDYWCQVTCAQLFSRALKVYGASENQAIALALMLVKETLTIELTGDR